MGYRKIPSILGVIILVVGLATGVLLIGQQQLFRLGASGSLAPQDVRISNVTDAFFTVSWVTQGEAVGYVSWGENTSLGQLTRQVESTPKKIHSATIASLSAGRSYYFVINSGGNEFDNNGVPWSVSTGPTLPAPTGTLLASGTVITAEGSPASNVLVYVNGGSVGQLSTVTSPNGTWTMPLSTARNRTVSSYVNFDENTVLDIFVQGGNQQTAAAQVFALQANPTPNITLGQTHDFRGNFLGGFNLPEADVNLPQNFQDETGGALDVSGEAESQSGEEVTLESIDEQGEVIFTSTPEFFGEGPPGANITITVESDPETQEVRVGTNGTWNFSPETPLLDGTHTISITWTDTQGFLRSLTRTFVVQAADEPGFESTPSGATSTPSPTPTASPTPVPTSTASPSPNPTPTPSPTRASIPSTESGIPSAGSLTPTILLATIGLALLFSGIVISKRNV